ncbi:MAG TPA: GTPase [Candidatus Thermoplasmatota archaeon]|nr:GTPase [Candidatus Thermoplasmatota archaeon]
MLDDVPTILSAQEILDKAFLRANKIAVPDPEKYHRVRKTEEAQMRCVAEVVGETLERYVKAFPNLEAMPGYEREVMDILVGLDGLRKALGHVDWARETLQDVYREQSSRMRDERTILHIQARKRQFSGRAASILAKVDKDLLFLRKARDKVRLLPTVHPEYPTVVIAGFPNVGKSSLLAAWTRAHPEVAAYPFTTKRANVGHFEWTDAKGVKGLVQVVDTPGLLDRPDAERNPVERQAVAALKHAADAVLFLLDATESSGYTMADQESLLAQVEREMSGIPLLVAETKADLGKSRSKRIKFSTTTGEGIEELKLAIVAMLPGPEPELELDPLEMWKDGKDPFAL